MRKKKKIVWRLARPIVLQCENGAVKFVLINYSTQVFKLTSGYFWKWHLGIPWLPSFTRGAQKIRAARCSPGDVHVQIFPQFWKGADALKWLFLKKKGYSSPLLTPLPKIICVRVKSLTPDPGETGISVNSAAPWRQHVVKCVLNSRIGRVKSPHRKML